MPKELPEADAVPAGLYSKADLSSQFNSEVGPGGYPCEGFNQPLLWYPISMDPPPDHPWAGPDCDDVDDGDGGDGAVSQTGSPSCAC